MPRAVLRAAAFHGRKIQQRAMWFGSKSDVVITTNRSFASVKSAFPSEQKAKGCAVSQPTHNQSRGCKVQKAFSELNKKPIPVRIPGSERQSLVPSPCILLTELDVFKFA